MQTLITINIYTNKHSPSETFFDCIFTNGETSFAIKDEGNILQQLYVLINDKYLNLGNNTVIAYNDVESSICYTYGTMSNCILFNEENLNNLKNIINIISETKNKNVQYPCKYIIYS